MTIYILNIASAIKRISVNEPSDFICEKYYKLIELVKERRYYSMKRLKKKDLLFLKILIEKILDPCNGKEHYQSFIRKENTKSIKQLKIITYQPKPF